ncbi:hypothetical protein like AT2G44600 [Hibiscus trionum]|uniref:Uncharacterized protein n=1 Tax=Hibiscus trionum TaxID=183268 RepID=A0A9W7ITN7_HIBTR|nr:hypothetical protein like AT2G44600 [Hibiscus trionum]
MRCKIHLVDLSSSVGVCSTCLRDRLRKLIAAQAEAEVGPTYSSATTAYFEPTRSFKKKNMFSLFSNLFKSRSENLSLDPRDSD